MSLYKNIKCDLNCSMFSDCRPKNCSISQEIAHALMSLAAEATRNKLPLQKSRSKVGAAVLAASGDMFDGTYLRGSTINSSVHAERVALVQAICAGAEELTALALYSDSMSESGHLVPCGSCLQFIHDFNSSHDMWIIIGTDAETHMMWAKHSALLPYPWKGR